ncbi:MAG: hypothetical protein O7D30_02030 [Rickettsia endosymbiont of Ixodes persulcatus]|nr:hypothetical protein [Rickettsia endosymbiont of Ixodes persulcatus]
MHDSLIIIYQMITKNLKNVFIVAYNINLWYYFYLQLDRFSGTKLLIITCFIII